MIFILFLTSKYIYIYIKKMKMKIKNMKRIFLLIYIKVRKLFMNLIFLLFFSLNFLIL